MSDGREDQKIHLELLNKIALKAEETQNSLKELDKCVNSLDKKMDLHIQKTEYELEKINQLDEHQNTLLDQHIAGVNTLKKWCDNHERANDKRFSDLETPMKWLSTTKTVALWLSAISGAVITVGKLLKFL